MLCLVDQDETPEEMERRFIREAREAKQNRGLERNRDARATARELMRKADDLRDRLQRQTDDHRPN
jgi:hypothetical protein